MLSKSILLHLNGNAMPYQRCTNVSFLTDLFLPHLHPSGLFVLSHLVSLPKAAALAVPWPLALLFSKRKEISFEE